MNKEISCGTKFTIIHIKVEEKKQIKQITAFLEQVYGDRIANIPSRSSTLIDNPGVQGSWTTKLCIV